MSTKDPDLGMLPNWRVLFGSGSLDQTECQDCHSVYSFAAYLANLLNFVNNSQSAALLELFRRRPDLRNIGLSCENTETEVPYIDIVNEVLENAVVNNTYSSMPSSIDQDPIFHWEKIGQNNQADNPLLFKFFQKNYGIIINNPSFDVDDLKHKSFHFDNGKISILRDIQTTRSGPSSSVQFIPPSTSTQLSGPQDPLAPTGLSVTPTAPNTPPYTLNWTAPASNLFENGQIIGYLVERSLDNSNWDKSWKVPPIGVNTLPTCYMDDNAVPNQTYYYRVSSIIGFLQTTTSTADIDYAASPIDVWDSQRCNFIILQTQDTANNNQQSYPAYPLIQTYETANELGANPAHTNIAAYETLADWNNNANFPISLPFNLWVEQARTYLKKLGTSLFEIMSTMRSNNLLIRRSRSTLSPDPNDKTIPAGLRIDSGVPNSTLRWNPAIPLKYYQITGYMIERSEDSKDWYVVANTNPNPVFLTGNGGPASNLGNNGDFYINTNTGDYYQKITGNWKSQGTFGPLTGTITTGTGSPDPLSGTDGDYYINTTTGDYYQHSNGIWVAIATIAILSYSDTTSQATSNYRVSTIMADVASSCEYFMISPDEWQAITDNVVAKKLLTPSLPTSSISVQAALDRTGLEFTDLVTLIKTNFINPNKTVEISIDPSEPSNLSKMFLIRLDTINYGLIPRFIRLWKKLGWQIQDLDRVTKALNATDIDNTLIANLASLSQIQSLLQIPLVNVCGLFSLIDTQGDDSLYNQIFLDPTIKNPPDSNFDLNEDNTALLVESNLAPTSIDGHTDVITSALGITGDDLAAMTTIGPNDSFAVQSMKINKDSATDYVLTLANLSKLYRISVLSQALNLSVKDFFALVELSKINPFDQSWFPVITSSQYCMQKDPSNINRFIQKADDASQFGFTIPMLNYIIRDIYDNADRIRPLENDVSNFFTTLRVQLQKARQQAFGMLDPKGELLRKNLPMVLTSDRDVKYVDKIQAYDFTENLISIINGNSNASNDANKNSIKYLFDFIYDDAESDSAVKFLTSLQPTSLKAIPVSYNEIDLSWAAPQASNKYAISGYMIERSTDGNTWSTLVSNTNSNTTSYADTSIPPIAITTTYYYRVSSIDAGGHIRDSSIANATIPASPKPFAPQGLEATLEPIQIIQLGWSVPSGLAILPTGFMIERSTDGGNTWYKLVPNTNNTSTTYFDVGVDQTLVYAYRVSAIYPGTTSNPSNPVSSDQNPLPAGTPDGQSPTNLTVTSNSIVAINLNWQEPPVAASSITGYLIEVNKSQDGGSTWSGFNTIVSNTNSTITSYQEYGQDFVVNPKLPSLAPGTIYGFSIKAINGGTGQTSDTSNPVFAISDPNCVITPAIGTPSSVTKLIASQVSTSEIDISWSVPIIDGTLPISGYMTERQVSTDGGNTWSDWKILVQNTLTTTTSYSDKGVIAGELYNYRITPIMVTWGIPPGSIYADITFPANGNNGDLFVNTQTGNYYQFVSGQWIKHGTLIPSTGSQIRANAGAPGAVGNDGDIYVDTNTGDYYLKNAGVWTRKDNLSSIVANSIVNAPVLDPIKQVPPGAPTEIDLSWTPPTINYPALIQGFQVERSTDATNWTLLTTLDSTSTTFQDKTLGSSASSYFYRVGTIVAGTSDSIKPIPPVPKNISDKFSYVTSRVVNYLLSKNIIEQALATYLNLKTASIDLLLQYFDNNGYSFLYRILLDSSFVASDSPISSTQEDFQNLFFQFYQLHKASLLINNFKITYYELNYLLNHPSDFANLSLHFYTNLVQSNEMFSFSQWEELLHLFLLRNRLTGGTNLFAYFGQTYIPNGLVASLNALGDTINLGWTSVSSADPVEGYLIERSNDEGLTWSFAGLVDVKTTSFADKGFAPNQSYVYRVSAIFQYGTGASSYSIIVNVPDIQVANVTSPNQILITLQSLPNPSSSGAEVTFTATLSPDPGGGNVMFTVDGIPQPPVVLAGGQANFKTSTLLPGLHAITAAYSGYLNYLSSKSATITQFVNPTNIILQSSLTPISSVGQQIKFIASVTPNTVTGTITFTIDGTPQPPVKLLNATAILYTSSLPAGFHSIIAQYSGDANNAPSSQTILQIVQLDIPAISGWDPNDVQKIICDFNLPNFFRNAHKIILLKKCFDISAKTGVLTHDLFTWSTNEISSGIAKNIKNTLKAWYSDDAQWDIAAQQVENSLRDKKEKALVSYLVYNMSFNICYLDTNTGNYYQKISGTWTPIGNVAILIGASVVRGNGPPGGGPNNNFYLDTTMGNYYQYTGGAWAQVTNNVSTGSGPPSTSSDRYYLDINNGNYYGSFSNWVQDGTLTPLTKYHVLPAFGAPNRTLGNDGDLCVNTQSWEFYLKIAGVWIPKGYVPHRHVGGPPIDYGNIDPNNTQGRNGDIYLNTATGDLFRKSGTWKKIIALVVQPGSIITNNADPTPALGNNGDICINTTTGSYFEKVSDKWYQLGTLSPKVGSIIRTGTTIPNSSIGNEGDIYINTTNGNYYHLAPATWTQLSNIQIPQGSILTGSGAPTVSGNNGYFYLDTTSGNCYQNFFGTWTLQANLIQLGSILQGNGAPDPSLGTNGAFYVDMTSNDYYYNNSGAWAKVGNTSTEPFINPSGRPPLSAPNNNQVFWFDGTAGNYYQNIAGTWVLEDNLVVPQKLPQVLTGPGSPSGGGNSQVVIPQVNNADDLFNFFLIDVQMSSCRTISRISLATLSVQLLVQRILLGLEQASGLSPEIIFNDMWSWMQSYTTWQAGRRVFLYPEAYIRPELRKDKTPFFEELMKEISQNNITVDIVTTAYQNYLIKLNEVAYLEPCGMFDDTDNTNLVHVFGRTSAYPRIYYYRTFDNFKSLWNPWEKVNVNIDGDHLIPAVVNKHPYIFWPTFKQETRQDPTETGSNYDCYLIGMAWSEYVNGKWSAKAQSTGKITDEKIDFNTQAISPYIADTYWHEVVSFESNPISSMQFYTFLYGNEIVLNISDDKIGSAGSITQGGFLTFIFQPAIRKIIVGYSRYPGLGFYLLPNTDTYYQWSIVNPSLSNSTDPGIGITANIGNRILCATNAYDPAFKFYPYVAQPKTIGGHRALLNYSHPLIFQDDANKKIFFLIPHGPFDPYRQEKDFKCVYLTFYHPFVKYFIQQLEKNDNISDLLKLDNQIQTNETNPLNPHFSNYNPDPSHVLQPYPEETVDFSYPYSPYSEYNWELFFHIPFLVATKLSTNQQFNDARTWFQYVFNPTTTSTDPVPQRYWNFKPFYDDAKNSSIQNIQDLFGNPDDAENLNNQVWQWETEPFDPFLIAQVRPGVYEKTVVMAYINNLLSWADQLFGQFTTETVNQATELYVLARELLGQPPSDIPASGVISIQTWQTLNLFAEILDPCSPQQYLWQDFAEAYVLLENAQPFVPGSTSSSGDSGTTGQVSDLLGIIAVPYFCIPQNDTLLGMWDTINQRIDDIRHCRNIQGISAQPSLPPIINPMLLVEAAAEGVDISSALSDIESPVPFYRFTYMIQKAIEACSDVKALGSTLLSALEKRDAEDIAMIRATQEVNLLNKIRASKQFQLDEANANVDAMVKSSMVAQEKIEYYSTRPYMSEREESHLELITTAWIFQEIAQLSEIIASLTHLLPEGSVGGSGVPPAVVPNFSVSWGGSNLGFSLQAFAGAMSFFSSYYNHQATMVSTLAGYDRRFDDWQFQLRLANKEIAQIEAQINASKIRVSIAQNDLDSHDLQIQNATDIQSWMQSKFTNKDLYDWMVSQVSQVYFQTYQMAFDLAKKAEKSYQFETGDMESSFIQFGYWDNLQQGLLSGENLHHDLKALEKSYMDKNKRTFEITKNISLVMINPKALLDLKEKGTCNFELSEMLFDMDFPGHYMRRIKSVSITIPCVAGPYTSINCVLTLLGSKIRTNLNVHGSPKNFYDDSNFVLNYSSSQSIATSHGQNDSGMFELNFRDERYLPFEGSGVYSQWLLEMPQENFDFRTISDVIIKINYTSWDGGSALRSSAKEAYDLRLASVAKSGMTRLFSARHEFSNEWQVFVNPATNAASLSFKTSLKKKHFPFQVDFNSIKINKFSIFLKIKKDSFFDSPDGNRLAMTLNGTASNFSFDDSDFMIEDVMHTQMSLKLLPSKDGGVDIEIPLTPGSPSWLWTRDNNDNNILNSEIIEDLVFICYYTAIPKDLPKFTGG